MTGSTTGSAQQTYIVRIWFEATGEAGLWRAAVTDTATQDKHYFVSPRALAMFLGLEQTSAHADTGGNDEAPAAPRDP